MHSLKNLGMSLKNIQKEDIDFVDTSVKVAIERQRYIGIFYEDDDEDHVVKNFLVFLVKDGKKIRIKLKN